jgi:hypothetical protein
MCIPLRKDSCSFGVVVSVKMRWCNRFIGPERNMRSMLLLGNDR